METGLVQNRLTIAGFTLALLVFVSSVLLSFLGLVAQTKDASQRADFLISTSWSYLNTVLPVFLGFIFAISSIVFLLQSQATVKTWMFDLGDVLLYLALSQFFSSGLNKIVNVLMIGLHSHSSLKPWASYSLMGIIKGSVLIMWVVLVFGAPLNRILRVSPKRNVVIGYTAAVLVIFISSALSYFLRGADEAGFGTFLKWFVLQFVQPLFW